MPEVFANTTPLQYLHRLGRLDWLRDFYGHLVVPEAVAAELDAGRKVGAQVPGVRRVPWIEIRIAPTNLEVFPTDIHRGEAEVLTLARASADALVIVDDGPARSHAHKLGLRITGTLGVILRAKRHGLIPAVAPSVHQLQTEGFRIAPATLGECAAARRRVMPDVFTTAKRSAVMARNAALEAEVPRGCGGAARLIESGHGTHHHRSRYLQWAADDSWDAHRGTHGAGISGRGRFHRGCAGGIPGAEP